MTGLYSLVDQKTYQKFRVINSQLPLMKVGQELMDSLFSLDDESKCLSMLYDQNIVKSLKTNSTKASGNEIVLEKEADSEKTESLEDKLKPIMSKLNDNSALANVLISIVELFYGLATKLDSAKKFLGGDYDATQLEVVDLNIKDSLNIDEKKLSNLSIDKLVKNFVNGMTSGQANNQLNSDNFAKNIFDFISKNMKGSKSGNKNQGNSGIDEKIGQLKLKMELTKKQIEAMESGKDPNSVSVNQQAQTKSTTSTKAEVQTQKKAVRLV